MADQDQTAIEFEQAIADILSFLAKMANTSNPEALQLMKNLRDALVARQQATGQNFSDMFADTLKSQEAFTRAFAQPNVGYSQQLALNQYKELKINTKPGADHKSNFHPAALHRPAKGVH